MTMLVEEPPEPPAQTPQGYFDRRGRAITFARWLALHARPGYRCVAQDVVGAYSVYTDWTGTEEGCFATYVWPDDEMFICWTWDTERQAKAGHRTVMGLAAAHQGL